MMSRSNTLACCISLWKGLQNFQYGMLCFLQMSFCACAKRKKKIFPLPLNFYISYRDKTERTVLFLPSATFLFSPASVQCVRNHLCSQVFTMGRLWGVIILPESSYTWWAGSCGSTQRLQPAVAAERNKQTENFITWCLTACDCVVLFQWLLAERHCGIFKELANIKGEVVLLVVAGGVAGGRGSPRGPFQAWERTGTGGQTSL